MNWRRGLLLAGIHLAVAGTLIVQQEVSDWDKMPSHAQMIEAHQRHLIEQDLNPREPTLDFSCEGLWIWIPPRVRVVWYSNLPAYILAEWRSPCPQSWALAKAIGAREGGFSHQSEVETAIGLCILIPLQWFLVGAYPLVRTPSWRKWWTEPGLFITVCAVSAGLLAMIPAVDGIALLFAYPAILGWFWWFGLLVWKSVRASRRLVLRKQTATV